jgi:hypothetical protein
MSKKKSYDLKDIIESSYVSSDYGQNTEYYDTMSTGNKRSVRSNELSPKSPKHVHSNQPYRFGSNNNDTFRNDSSSGNIFLKNSKNSFSNTSTSTSAFQTKESAEQKKIELNDDNFPSLGSKSTPTLTKDVKHNNTNSTNSGSSTENKLDFKRVVEKKVEVVNKPEVKTYVNKPCRFKYGSDSLYYGIKEKSEKIAHLKMANYDMSSDDEDYY